MLMFGPALPKRPPHGKQGRNEAVDRLLANEAQHGGTREVSLECVEEKSSVDRRPDPNTHAPRIDVYDPAVLEMLTSIS